MDAARFDEAMSALRRLLDANLSSLSGLVSVLRPDGLPQDWVDDVPNMTGYQRSAMAAEISENAPAWAQAFANHLTG